MKIVKFITQPVFNDTKWMHPSLSELTPIIFEKELTHLDSEASKYSVLG